MLRETFVELYDLAQRDNERVVHLFCLFATLCHHRQPVEKYPIIVDTPSKLLDLQVIVLLR